MKILRIAWWKRTHRAGGLIEYVEDIMAELVKRGHQEIYFFAGSYDLKLKPYLKEYKGNGIKYYELVNSPNIAPERMERPLDECHQKTIERLFEDVLSKEMPDIVHIHELEGLTAGIIDVAKNYKIPLIFSIHNYWPFCSQVHLFDYVNGQICDDYDTGRRCVKCELYSPHKTTGLTKWLRRADKFKKKWGIHYTMIVLYGLAENIFCRFRTYIGTKDQYAEEQAKRYVKRRRCFIEKLNKKVDTILAISNITKEVYVRYGINKEKIHVVYRGLKKIDAIKPKPYRNTDYPIVFGFMGGCASHKGLDTLIAAFSRLDQNKAKLVVYGWGNPEYIGKIKAKRLNIEFKGTYEHEAINHVFEEIDVGVVPSIWYEAFGLVGIEFLQARIPIIVSDLCGVAETIEDGKTGFIIKPNDTNALLEKLELFITNPELIRSLQKNIKRFKSVEEHASELEQIYNELIRGVEYE